MRTAKIFKSGNSQAVRLPKSFQFTGDEVEIIKCNDDVILRPLKTNLTKAFEILTTLPKDFFADGRNDQPPQDRDFYL